MKSSLTLLAGAFFGALSTPVLASSIILDNLGGPVSLNAGSMTGLTAGSGAMDEAAMALLHADLHADGIGTDNMITFLLANSEAGLTFVALVDDNTVGQGFGSPSQLVLTTTAPDDVSAHVNAEGGDLTAFSHNAPHRTFSAMWGWNGAFEGDGYAWGNLGNGDFLSYNLQNLGSSLDGGTPMQFVSFDDGVWSVAATADFFSTGQFVFTGQVVPGPGVLAMIALAGMASGRRSRN